ncbi:ATP-binding protein [Micromonospora sp. WMMA1998]|uniref:ATP-binding protein n=1 Tax=Micromonospora sp. WMMA1998 TaxID=3015167 RepID=UPI00248CF2CA|nr:ATP-binding protein [Micromonospora sp. WMMA1998]WBC16693.1 ATP-binding protein [Micromonospora sp. WMMA1998]
MQRLGKIAAASGCVLVGACVVLTAVAAREARGDLERADQLFGVIGGVTGVIGAALALVGLVVSVVLGSLQLRAARSPQDEGETRPDAASASAVPAAGRIDADIDRLRVALAVAYDQLFGVDDMVDQVGEILKNPVSPRILSVWGGAGYGKTTLVYEAARRHTGEAGFARLFGISAKFTHIGPAGLLKPQRARITSEWRDILVELAKQVDPTADVDATTVEEALPGLFPAAPCLVVVDNLETVPEARQAVDYLVARFAESPHRFLLTTRESVAAIGGRWVTERRWNGPSAADAKRYADHLARHDTALDPTDADLDDVVEAAECAPLLIQIIVRYAAEKTLTIAEVVRRLRDRGGQLGNNVWRYCYAQSMQALADGVGSTQDAIRLMGVFCFVPAGRSVTDQEFFAQSRIADREQFLRVRELACRLTLVRALEGNTRFTVHSLLREHFCGNVDDTDAAAPAAR